MMRPRPVWPTARPAQRAAIGRAFPGAFPRARPADRRTERCGRRPGSPSAPSAPCRRRRSPRRARRRGPRSSRRGGYCLLAVDARGARLEDREDRGPFLVTLDPEGNRASVGTPKGPTTAFEYDELGKLTKVTQPPSNPDLDPTPPVTAYAYDETRDRVRQTDASLAPRWRTAFRKARSTSRPPSSVMRHLGFANTPVPRCGGGRSCRDLWVSDRRPGGRGDPG